MKNICQQIINLEAAFDRQVEKAERWDRRQARLPKCSWKGCESRAPYPFTGHEGMHEDDQYAESFCAYHEHEAWYVSCVAEDVARELGIDLEFAE